MGKPKIVTDGHSKTAPRRVGDHGFVARLVQRAFPIVFAIAELRVEHVQLVITGDDFALAVNQEGSVGETVLGDFKNDRTDQNPSARLDGHVSKGGERRIVLF